MKSYIVLATLLGALSAPAFAGDAAVQAAKEMIPLADGGTLYIFKDDLMAQEDRFGRATYQKIGTSVVAKDGRNIAITSNEVARLYSLLRKGHRG
ncbi:MAG: CopK family periplasmic copper-binding protein [Gammaproteobacteria bacterium]|nr:CopK family periplasmic copper-binding protein [Burkholderiales bacterium]